VSAFLLGAQVRSSWRHGHSGGHLPPQRATHSGPGTGRPASRSSATSLSPLKRSTDTPGRFSVPPPFQPRLRTPEHGSLISVDDRLAELTLGLFPLRENTSQVGR
jgi:hypothetical protein